MRYGSFSHVEMSLKSNFYLTVEMSQHLLTLFNNRKISGECRREGARMVKIHNQVIMQDLNVGKLYK